MARAADLIDALLEKETDPLDVARERSQQRLPERRRQRRRRLGRDLLVELLLAALFDFVDQLLGFDAGEPGALGGRIERGPLLRQRRALRRDVGRFGHAGCRGAEPGDPRIEQRDLIVQRGADVLGDLLCGERAHAQRLLRVSVDASVERAIDCAQLGLGSRELGRERDGRRLRGQGLCDQDREGQDR